MWVRFDDNYPLHRKIAGLSHMAFRFHGEVIAWCNRNKMDGWIPADDLELISQRVEDPKACIEEFLKRKLAHPAGDVCAHEDCPADGSHPDGWILHDVLDYQPSKAEMEDSRAKNAERQRRHRERQAAKKSQGSDAGNGARNQTRSPGSNGVTDDVTNESDDALEARERNGVSNGVTNASVTGPRPDPSPTEEANASSGAAKRPRKVDPIWDALMAACAVDTAQIPKSSRGAYNNAVKDLKGIGATPAQITLRARRYQSKWPTASLTPTALVRRWPELDTGTAAPVSEAETARCPKHKRQPLSHCQICDSEKRGAA